MHAYVRACVCACVRAFVCVCVRACVRACVSARRIQHDHTLFSKFHVYIFVDLVKHSVLILVAEIRR